MNFQHTLRGTVSARSRLHFGLLDVAGSSGRRYGGSGLMISDPTTHVWWETGPSPITMDLASLDTEYQCQVVDAVQRMSEILGVELAGRVGVKARPPSHRGYGSKTAMLMAILDAALHANRTSVPPSVLAQLSGRGGASGVGVHGYELGGLIVDAGHRSDARLGPSSSGAPDELPLLVAHRNFPTDWAIGMIDLLDGRVLTRKEETELFQRGDEHAREDATSAPIAAVYHGILAGVATNDLELFSDGLNALQTRGFKKLEIEAQSPSVRELLIELRAVPGVACGMSSLGPLVFAICHESDKGAIDRIDALSGAFNCEPKWTRAWNGEREIEESLG